MSDDKVLVLPNEHEAEPVCQSCGSFSIDTGYECNDCGFDNWNWYHPHNPYKGPTTP